MLFSLIIPVYNVEKYIERCIKSCLNQHISQSDYEIIAINDGSTDRSGSILRNLQNNCNNLRVITQVNKGVSAARNTGVANAKGDYIWFIDSDDFIEETALKILSLYIKKFKDCKLFRLDYYVMNETDIEKSSPKISFFDKSFQIVCTKIHLSEIHHFESWQFIVQRKFWNAESFHFKEGIEGVVMEDTELWPFVIVSAEFCVDLRRKLYCYYQRDTSVLHNPNADRYMPSLLHVMIKLKKAVEKDNIYEDVYLSSVRGVFGYVTSHGFEKWRNVVVATCKQYKIHGIVKNDSIIKVCINKLLTVSPKLFLYCVMAFRSFYIKYIK